MLNEGSYVYGEENQAADVSIRQRVDMEMMIITYMLREKIFQKDLFKDLFVCFGGLVYFLHIQLYTPDIIFYTTVTFIFIIETLWKK